MTTQGINLIPGRRLELRRRRSLRRRCVIYCAAYAAIAGGSAMLALAFVNQNVSGVAAKVAAATLEVERATAETSQVRTELESTNSVLRASRAISEQPDWSSLLALFARKAGNEVTLKGCSVRPRETPTVAKSVARGLPAKPPAAPDPTVLVNVSGMGSSQAAVSQFALRLEATGLFDRVTLVDTSREPFVGMQLVAFRLECTLAEPNKAMRPIGAPRQLAGVE